MRGAKILEVQHQRTRRRSGSGTWRQFGTERGRSVSALEVWPGKASPDHQEVAKPITVAREVAERRAEVGGGHTVAMIGVDNKTRRSQGPLARCAIPQRPTR